MDLQLYPLNKTETLHKLMAILFRPITKKDSFGNYKIESYNGTNERAELFKYMPMNVVNGAIIFFLTLQKQLLAHIQKSTIAEQQKEVKQMITLLNGVGTPTLDKLANNNILNYEKVLKLNVHVMHTFLAHDSDKQKLEASLRKGKNTIEL